MQEHCISPPVLQELERQRRIARTRFLKTVLSVGVLSYGGGLGTFFGLVGSLSGDGLIGTLVGATFLTVFAIALGQMYFMSYRRNFKNQVTSGLVQRIDPELRHKGEEGLTRDEFEASLLFRDEPRLTKFRSEDLTYGSVRGVPLRFSEAKAQREFRSGGKSQSETIFRGVLCRVQLAHATPHPLVVVPRLRKRDETPNASGLLPFRCGDPAFDAAFSLFSTHPEAARSLASPELRNLVLGARKAGKGRDFRLSLVGDALYFSFAQSSAMVEPPWFTPLESLDLSSLVAGVHDIVELASEFHQRLTPGLASA